MDPGDGSEVQNKTGLDTTGTISSNEQEVIGMLLAQTTQGTTEAGQLAQHVVSVQVRKRQGIGSSLELAQFPVTPLGGPRTLARQTFSWLSLATQRVVVGSEQELVVGLTWKHEVSTKIV